LHSFAQECIGWETTALELSNSAWNR
jgi:hypothetical protein